jgi:hypothetical protein
MAILRFPGDVFRNFDGEQHSDGTARFRILLWNAPFSWQAREIKLTHGHRNPFPGWPDYKYVDC